MMLWLICCAIFCDGPVWDGPEWLAADGLGTTSREGRERPA